MSAGTTPNDVARDLGIEPKALRDWLRATYPRREDSGTPRWYLTTSMAEAADQLAAPSRSR